jgi:hypothetical protein
MASVKTGDTIVLTLSDKKLRELALYIAERSKADPAFGATKLNKLLFFSDFLAYLNFGKSITGQIYFRLNNGPAPKRWMLVRERMCQDGDLAIKKQDFFGFPQIKLIPLRPPDTSRFSVDELRIVDMVIDKYISLNASQISDESHGFIGWSLAKDKEEIPIEVALVFRPELNEQIVTHGLAISQRRGSVAA